MSSYITGKVTVVIPCYNHQHFVIDAIESVLGQCYKSIELIVIDDGSTDGSKECIAAHARRYRGTYRFISQSNRGLLHCLQQGLKMATGEYFCELASDDYLALNSIGRRVERLSQHPRTAAVYTDAFEVNAKGEVGSTITKAKTKNMYLSPDPIPAMLNNITPIFATSLCRTSLLKQVGGFDYQSFRYYEDLDTPVRLSLGGDFDYIDEPLFYRRTHEKNISSTTNHVRREKIIFFTKLLKYPGMEKYHRLLNKMARRSVLQLSRTLKESQFILPIDYQALLDYSNIYCYDLRILWNSWNIRYNYERRNSRYLAESLATRSEGEE